MEEKVRRNPHYSRDGALGRRKLLFALPVSIGPPHTVKGRLAWGEGRSENCLGGSGSKSAREENMIHEGNFAGGQGKEKALPGGRNEVGAKSIQA